MSTSILRALVVAFFRDNKIPTNEDTAKRWFKMNASNTTLESRFIKNLKRKGYVID